MLSTGTGKDRDDHIESNTDMNIFKHEDKYKCTQTENNVLLLNPIYSNMLTFACQKIKRLCEKEQRKAKMGDAIVTQGCDIAEKAWRITYRKI